jgi:hypothetical protein
MASTQKGSDRVDEPAAAMVCGVVCDSYGCWKKCRRPDGHSGPHQCDDHGGSS